MSISRSASRANTTPMKWFVVMVVLAVGLALLLPPTKQMLLQLHTSPLAYHVAVAVLLIPYCIIWLAAFYAFTKVWEYTRYIRQTTEGSGFRDITTGMGILAFGLVIPTIVSLVMGVIVQRHPDLHAAQLLLNDYLNLLVAVLAFSYISQGARKLASTTKARPDSTVVRWFAALFLLFSVLYAYFGINDYHIHKTSYPMGLYALLITFITPYLYAWFMALFSALDFRLYSRYAKGVLYQRALRLISAGITIVALGSVAIQFTSTTIVARISNQLGVLLIAEYILLAIIAIGLVLLALGTKKLKKIEEV